MQYFDSLSREIGQRLRRWPSARKALRVSAAACVLSCLVGLAASPPAAAQALYGIVAEPPYAGYLVKIDIKNGDVTRLFPTGVPSPAGLTYDPVRSVLLTIAAGTGQIYRIDLESSTTSPLLPLHEVSKGVQALSVWNGAKGLAYGKRNDVLHTMLQRQEGGSYEHSRLTASSGALESTDGSEAAWEGTERIAVGPFDGVPHLMGWRLDDTKEAYENSLATCRKQRHSDDVTPHWGCATCGESCPICDEACQDCLGDEMRVNGADFHPTSGDVYVSYGRTLLILDDGATGTVKPIPALADESHRAYIRHGRPVTIDSVTCGHRHVKPLARDIGVLGGIAFAKPAAPDVWMKDCDEGDCRDEYNSPDIWIDTDSDRRLDRPRYGEDNWLYARVRNRSEHDANDTSVAFYYWECGTAEVAEGEAPRKLVDQSLVDVPAQGTAIARVKWADLPKRRHKGAEWCIQAVLNHPDDQARVPASTPGADNNVAATDTKTLTERDRRGKPRKRAVLTSEERVVLSYPGELESTQLGGYPIPYAQRPLVMQRGMMRFTSSFAVKQAGTLVDPTEETPGRPLQSVDAGIGFALHRNIEVGFSNYRLGSTLPKAGQGLITVTFHEEERAHYGDIPIYGRFQFLDRDKWNAAADLVLVFPVHTKLAATLALPIRVRPRGYDLAIDWGIEATLLTENYGANVELPVKLTYNITHRGFVYVSSGLSLQQFGRRFDGENPTRDSNVAFPAPMKNQVFIPLALGGGYTLRPVRVNRRVMVDFLGHGGFNPLIYFNPNNNASAGRQIDEVPLRESWFLTAGTNIYWDPVIR